MLINIPWYVRWGFDVSLFVVPYLLVCSKQLNENDIIKKQYIKI